MPKDNESTKWLYEQLSKKGYDVGKDAAEFDNLMRTNKSSREWAYKTAKSNGLDVGKDQSEFDNLVAPKAPAETQRKNNAGSHAQQVVDEYDHTANQSTRKNQNGSTRMTDAEKNSMMSWAANMQNGLAASKQQTENRLEYQTERAKNPLRVNRRNLGVDTSPYHLGENPNVVETSKRYDPATGKLKSTYITSAGNEYENRSVADLEQNQIDDAQARALDPINTSLRDAYAERDRLNELMAQRMKEIDDENKGVGSFLREFAEASRQPGTTNPMSRYQIDEQYRQLEAAARKNNAAIQTLEDQRDNKMNEFWHSALATAGNGYTFNDGLSEINDAIALLDARKHIDSINKKRSEGKPLTKEEEAAEAVLRNEATNNAVQNTFGNYGAWARAGMMLPTSIDMMKDIMLTPGAGSIAKGVAKNIAGLNGKYLAKEAGETAVKAIPKAIARGILKGTGIVVGAHTAGAVVSNTAGIGHTAAEMGNNLAGETTIDEQGNIKNDGGMDFMEALADAERNQIRENGSEMFGELLPGLGGVVTKGLDKLGLSKLTGALQNIGNKHWYQQYSTLLKAGGYNGIPGEAIEEYEGIAFDALTGHAEDAWKQIKDPKTHIDIWLGCATMGALLGAVPMTIQGAHTAQYYRYKHTTDVADKVASYRIGQSKWDVLRDRIDLTPNEKMADEVMGILDSDMRPEEKRAILDYVRNLTKMRGFNIAQTTNNKEQPQDVQQVNQSYSDGYNAQNDEDMQDIKNRYERNVSIMTAGLGINENALDGTDWITEAQMEASDGTEEGRQRANIILDYVNSKQAYDGMIQRVRDDIDSRVAESGQMVDSRTNKNTGMIQGATLKVQDADGNDRKAYVLNGNLVMLPDGTGVDREKSDGSILIIHEDTGEMEMVSPEAILNVDEPIDPEMEKQTAAETIRQTYGQQEANRIDGVVPFNPGDTYTLTGEDGQPVQVQIVANQDGLVDNGDGTVNVSSDGGQTVVPMRKEDVQAMVDATNRARVEQAEMQREAMRTQAQPTQQSGYRLNDEVSLTDENGNEVRGSITGDINEDGRYEVYTESPINGRKVNLFTAEELNRMQTNPAENFQQEQPAQQPVQAEQPQQSALERIPKDEKGQPIYEQADPDTAWDALLEQSNGDEVTAQEVADDMVADKEAALKKLEKQKPKRGTTPAEKIAARLEQKRIVEQAQTELNQWRKIAQTSQRRKQAALTEQSRQAEEEARLRREQEERERAEREEAERIRREALNGVPDIIDDTPQDARARGYRRVNGEKVDRQAPLTAHQGKEVQVKFDDKNIPTGHVALIEAGQLQPSHINGRRNPFHFIDEAQPKERNDEASVMSARRIAANIRPEEITSSVTAYTGAPTVNIRGEVIQGNNRSAALREMWSGQPEQAAVYKQYLADHAADFELTPEDVEAMQQPVLVNMVDVPDEEAINLGQFVAQDTESGGTERIKPKNIVQKMSGDMRTFASRLLSSPDEEMTFSELVDRNGMDVLKWMQQKAYITPTQYRSAFDSKDNLTAEAKNDLKGIMYQSIFQGGSTHLEEMFNSLPAKAQKAILATAYRDYDSPNTERLNTELQNSISAYYALSQMPDFANSKNYKEARKAAEAWKRQLSFDDVTSESYLPSERYSNFALLLATMYKGQTQVFIQNTLKNIFDLVQGTKEATLFEEPDNTPRTLVEAVNETMNGLSDELLLNENFIYNGQRRNNVLAGGSAAGQQRRQGSTRDDPSGGRTEGGTGITVDNRGTEGSGEQRETTENANDGLRGNDRGGTEVRPDARQGYLAQARELDQNGIPFIVSSDGTTIFGNIHEDSGLKEAPIKLSEGFNKKDENGNDIGYGLSHINAKHGKQILNAGFNSVEQFVENVTRNYKEIRIGRDRKSNKTYMLLEIHDNKHKRTLYVELSRDGSCWNVNSGGIFKNNYTDKNDIAWPEPTVGSNADTDTTEVIDSPAEAVKGVTVDRGGNSSQAISSNGKDTEKSAVTQTIGEKVAQAEAETNQNPTEAQKEAGNYKKGHVRIGQFDITVENPKGSVRRGTDANGNPWETTMQNTYGYIRGTEGVDGDHIDVFLTNEIDGWNGRRVYVVDQYNEEGTFDEHKVMLGFNDEDDARNAYFSNYSKDWADKRKIVMTSTNLEDFEKWIDSSHRKTKPFADYKGVKKETTQPITGGVGTTDAVGYSISPAQYTTKRGKVLDMFLVKFAEPLTKEQQRAAKELAKAEKGWHDRGKGGFMMRSEESARKLADTIIGNGEAVNDAQPLSLADTRKLEGPAMRKVDVEGLMQAIQENGEAKLSDHFVDEQAGERKPKNSGQFGLVSDERMEELKKLLKQKIHGQMNSGIPPEVLAWGMELTAGYIDRGIKKFADYAKVMIDDMGDAFRPYLKAFYNGTRDLPEVVETGLADEMTPYDEVRTFDVANFDRSNSNAFATAEMVVQEQEANRQAEEAKKQLINKRNEERKSGKRQKQQEEPKIADLFSGQEEFAPAGQSSSPFQKGDAVVYQGKPATVYDIEDNGRLMLDTGLAPVLYESADPKEVKPANTATQNVENTEINRIFANAVKTDMLAALDSGTKPYRSILDLRKRAAALGMEVDNDGRTDILLQELVEDGLVRAAREVVEQHGRYSRESYDLICKLYDMQPTIAARSSNRIKMQQYSTPLPMAWNAARFAMSGKQGGKVLEPTAGNGMLVFAVPANQVHVNELDETRLVNLREQGFAQVTQQDATEPFDGGQQYDVVIANPPFGKREGVEYDGKMIPGLDPQITLNALASMKDDGKAAIIIGGNMEYGNNGGLKSMKPFFTYLYDHYNVKGVVDMDGKLYSKQGTTFPTRMILIAGRRSDEERAQTAVYPPVESKAIRKADSFDDLYDIIDEVINSKEKTNGTEILRSQQGQLVSVADQPSRNTDGKRHTEQSRTDDTSGRGRRTSVEGTQEQGEVVLRGEHRADTGNGEARRGTGGNTTGGSRGVPEPDVQRVGRVGVSTDRVGLSSDQKKRNLTEEKLPYRPHNSAFSLESVAPAAMVEAMDNVLSQIEAENGNIDEFVRKELGYDTIEETHQALAAEQVDSVAMAIYQMKKGQALIIGDQTGVGKGRQMAALIRWAVKRGEKPIFITQKADLFSDIYRDLVDIGSGDLVPFIFNSPSAKENKGEMVDANGKVVYKGLSDAKMKKVMATGKLPDEYDYAVLTYSQVNSGDEISQKEAEEAAKKRGGRTKKSKASKDGKATPKATFLRVIAEDNYLFLDESHTAAGTSNTGAYLQSILRSAKAATFASATFAKRPDTMPLYAIRTAMSQAKVEPDKLIGIIEKGGVTLQEIMSRELTNAGQMVRRERDMSDVVTDWKTINDPATVKLARENYDRTIAAFNAIIKFQEDYVKPMVDAMDKELAVMAESAGIKRGTDKMGVENVPFASKTYNYTKQLMLALKVDAIANEVDAEIKAGRHPVIALESTMESSIKDYSAGEVIAEPTFSASLLRGLDTVMQYTIKDENGKEQHARYSPNQLGEAGEKAYYELQDFIRKSTSDIFISPLDAIIERLHGMGYKVGELTGRNMYVERDDEGRVVVKRRTDKDKKRMQREFNSGELDVLILNKSASTGISLHASEKFSDQRQRTMIIAQPLSDINDYMQMIGRIDRTGQVHRGYYINLGLPVPAENRFLMMLSTKLKSLNANTTTSQDSESNDVEAPDLLNKYGSQVVVEYLRDNPEIYEKMGSPLKKAGQGGGRVQTNELDEYKPQEDDARKITGYVALLTTKEQEEFYDDVVRRYNELIKYLNDTGNNDLKITVMPLRAKTLNKRVSSEGIDPTGTNPFARNSYVEQVEMDVLRKPMKAAEIRKTIEQVNKGKRPEDYIRQVIATIEKEDEVRIATEEARYERSKVKAQEDIAKQTEKINRQQKRTAEEKQAAIADYARETNENVETKHNDNMVRLNTNSDMLKQRLHMFEVGKSYLMPDNLESMVFDFSTPAIFCGYKAKDSKITASTTLAVFATLDGRRRMEIKLSQPEALRSIYKTTNDNWDAARSTTLENWDSQIPTGTRKTGFIMTGNILQAIADTQDEHGGYPGQLISYTDIDGNVHDGILMPDKWNTSMLKTSGAPIISRLKQIKDYMPVTSHDGKVDITGSSWAKVYYLTVPKTKKDGAIYYENKALLRAVNGSNFYPYRGKLRADIPEENIERVVRELSKLGVKVKEETNENDALYRLDDYTTNEEEANDLFRVVDDASEIARLNSEPTVKVYRAMSLVDGKLYPPMSKKIGTGSNRISQSPSEFGQWEVSDERPELVEKEGTHKNHIYIVKDNGKGLWVAYNPYFHTSRNPLNDQFAEAYQRPNLVTVEVEVPESELTSGYQAEGAKDPVGETKWNAGPVNRQLRGDKKRKVILSRWMRPVRIVPDSEVAQRIAELIEGENVAIPDNTVTPSLLEELKKLGVKIVDGISKGRKKATAMMRGGNGALTDDELSYENDPVAKMTGRSTRTAAQRRAFAEKERQRMMNAVQELAEKLHLDNVDIVTDASTLQGRRAKAKGFYSRGTGRITIVIPNHTSVYDVEQTLLHEAVAHYGLRQLFGEHFDTFLDNVFQNADENVRRRITELARERNWDFRTATEEYLASLAEDTNFENINASWWQKIKELFLRMLHKIGFENFSGVTLSDNELRYILWRSYENLAEPGRYRSILGEAEDVAKQNELKVGNYAPAETATSNAAEDRKNTNSGDDLYRDNEDDASAIYEKGVANTFWNRFSEGWYDYLRSVRVLQDALQKAMSRKPDDFENVLLHSLHKTSVDKAQWDKLKKNYIDPLSKSLAKVVDGKKMFRDGKLTQDDVEIYLNCKHGLERNDKFAMRDAEQMRDERIKKADDELAKEEREAKSAMDRAIKRADQRLQDGEIDGVKHDQLINDAKEEYDKSIKKAEDTHEKAVKEAENNVTKDYQKNRKRDYSGLTEIFNPEKEGGYTNAELEDLARQYVADMEQTVPKQELDELWDKIHKLNAYSLRKSYESGLVSKHTYENTKDMFDYYVPLRGFEKETANDVYDYITESDIPVEQVMKHAKGRTSRATHLIATMMNMAHSSIVSGNRNIVKQKLLNLALNADNDLLTVGNQWYEDDGMGGWIPVQEPPIRDGMTAKEAREVVEQFEENMKEREKNGEVRRMRKGVSLPVRIVGKRAENEHGVRVKRNGQEYVVWINGNPKAAQAINGILNPETERGWVLDHIHKLNRFVSKNVTSLRPNFLLSNLKRDILSSNMVGFVKYGIKYTRMFDKFVKDNLSIVDVKGAKAGKMRGIYALYHRYNNGTLDLNDKRDRYFKEFMENGGETGYSQMWSIDDYEKQIRRTLNKDTAKEKFRNSWQAVGDAVEFANRGIENVCRFAAYMASRESGMSVLQSIADAKEASVNFNRKGSGAMGNNAARAMFMFLNPAIQGFMQHNKLLMKYPKRMLAIDGSLIALGVLVGLANCLIWGGGDDDDDDKEVEDDYFNINPFVRRNNIVLRVGQHEYAKIDLPQELRPWYGLGEIAYAAMTEHMKHDNVGVELFSQLTQTIPLNPITGNTILDPNESLGVGIIRNLTGATSLGSITDAYLFDKDYAGNKITKASEYNKLDPEWKRAGRGTSSLMIGTTRMLNDLTGGNDYKKGIVDLNPSRLEHVATSMLGGRVEFFKQLWTTGQALTSGDEDERNNMRNYPFISTSYINTDNSYNRNYNLNNEFDWYQHEFEQARHEFNGLKNDKKNVFEKAEEFNAFIQTPEYKIYRRFKKYDRRLKKQFDKLSDETDDDKRKKINDKITEIKKEAVEEMQSISK